MCYLCIPPAPNEACTFAPQAAVSLIFHPEYKVLYFITNNNNNNNNNNKTEGTLSLVKVRCVRETEIL
jgi:hypothetical protein